MAGRTGKKRLWEKAVIAFLQRQNDAVDGRRIISEATGISHPFRRLGSSRNCPSLFQIATWAKSHESVRVTLCRRRGLASNYASVNFYEWVGGKE